MKKLALGLIQLCFLLVINAQNKCECEIPIHYKIDVEEFEVHDIVLHECEAKTDTVIKYISSKDRVYLLYIKDCQGEAEITRLVDGRIFSTHIFANSLDTLKEYITLADPVMLDYKIVVSKHFEALENGYREYFDDKGITYKKVRYNMGIEEEN